MTATIDSQSPPGSWEAEIKRREALGSTPPVMMSERIAAILSDDPACSGRVTTASVLRIAALVEGDVGQSARTEERTSLAAFLHAQANKCRKQDDRTAAGRLEATAEMVRQGLHPIELEEERT